MFQALRSATAHLVVAAAMASLASCGGGGSAAAEAQPVTVTPLSSLASDTTAPGLDRRLIVGYQGWYGCPGDFDGNTEWVHWFQGSPAAGSILVDMLPSTDALADADLCDTGLTRQNGKPLRLFSSQNPNVVDYHFQLMAKHGVGAVAVQRFVVELEDARHARRVDNVLKNVMAAAQRNGVPFYITYDVSGANPATVVQTVRQDWQHLVADLQLVGQAQYLRDAGKPVVQLWGFGITDRPGEPAEVLSLLTDLKNGSAGLTAVTTIGGVASAWRTLDGDSKTAAAWTQVYMAFDVISPWTVGRYATEDAAATFFAQRAAADQTLVKAQGLRYMPVVFPGFSWHNLMMVLGQPAKALVNQIPRSCGNFIWKQSQLVVGSGSRMAYVAMLDEFDEGTAMLPAEPLKAAFPSEIEGVYLNRDGCSLAADWYMTVLGKIAGNIKAGIVQNTPLLGG